MSGDSRESKTWRLYADLGNSSLHWAARRGQAWVVEGRLAADALDRDASSAEIASAAEAAGLAASACSGSALVASRPSLVALGEAILTEVCEQPPRVLGRELRSDLAIGYYDPAEIGQDRLAAVGGALDRFPPPLVVLGLGTCLTAEAVSADGTVVGGAIAPGLEAQVAGLQATVPHLQDGVEAAIASMRSGAVAPDIGRSTAENLWLGLLAALVGTAERLVVLMRKHAGAQASVIATGGDARLVATHTEVIDRVEPMLVLDGLRAIDERRREEERPHQDR